MSIGMITVYNKEGIKQTIVGESLRVVDIISLWKKKTK